MVNKGTISYFFYRANSSYYAARHLSIQSAGTINRIDIDSGQFGNNNNFNVAIYDSSGNIIVNMLHNIQLLGFTWYHISLDFDIDEGNTHLYLDGEVVGVGNAGVGSRIGVVPGSKFWLGAGATGSGSITDIYIDCVRIYSTRMHYSDFDPPSSELILPGEPGFTKVQNTFGYPFGMRGFSR